MAMMKLQLRLVLLGMAAWAVGPRVRRRLERPKKTKKLHGISRLSAGCPVGSHERSNGLCSTLQRGMDVCTPAVEGGWRGAWFGPGTTIPELEVAALSCLEPPTPVVGLGGPGGFERDPSQDFLHVSFSGVGWESNPLQDTYPPPPV